MGKKTAVPAWITEFAPEVSKSFWSAVEADEDRQAAEFAHYASTVPAHNKIILYESMSGSRMDGNPYALFDRLYNEPTYADYFHVWSLSNRRTIPDKYKNASRVLFIKRGTPAFSYFLARAAYTIVNSTLPWYYVRKHDQLYLNTWHGIPYKTLGRRSPGNEYGSARGTHNLIQATHLITPSSFLTDAQMYAYSLAGVSSATIAETGYPRIDLTLNQSASSKNAIRERLGLGAYSVPENDARLETVSATSPDSGEASTTRRPVVMYAPTWRAEGSEGYFDSTKLQHDLQALSSLDVDLVFRGHPRAVRFLKEVNFDRVIVPPLNVTTNELLSAVDVLITDYSSVFFDFLPTGKPIVHYLYDVEQYSKTRGLTLTVDELPGLIAYDQTELVAAVKTAADTVNEAPAPRYMRAQKRFANHENGESTQRVLDFFLKGQTHGVATTIPRGTPKTVLFWAEELRDSGGDLTFVDTLSDYLADDSWSVALVLSRKTRRATDVFRRIADFGERLSIIAPGKHDYVVTDDERGSWELRHARSLGVEARWHCDNVYERQCRLLVGDARFDRTILAPQASIDARRTAQFSTFAGELYRINAKDGSLYRADRPTRDLTEPTATQLYSELLQRVQNRASRELRAGQRRTTRLVGGVRRRIKRS